MNSRILSSPGPVGRTAIWLASIAASLFLVGPVGGEPPRVSSSRPKVFRLWAMGCSHVDRDIKHNDRESLGEAIRQSEGRNDDGAPPFDWDVAVHLGDLSATQGYPTDDVGREVVRQFSRTAKHRREDFYNIEGNHDASDPGGPTRAWFQKWVDPIGENTRFSTVDPDRRTYPVEGTAERYSFRVGNILFLMMSDHNYGGPPVGRIAREGHSGGYPAGAVTGETFRWWRQKVEENNDSIIISTHHHMLRETTVGSGPFEGFTKTSDGGWRSNFHGYFPDGGPRGASYLYFVDGKPDAQAFEGFLEAQPNSIDVWLGGHTHTKPDDRTGGRCHVERKWDVNFINCAALTRHHVSPANRAPMSRLLTFTEGSDQVRVQCYLHTSDFASIGWYQEVERAITLSKPFRGP